HELVWSWQAELARLLLHGPKVCQRLECRPRGALWDSSWRTPLTEHHRHSRANSSRCSPPRAELALMPTVTGRVAATGSARRGGRRGYSAGLVRLLECMTCEQDTLRN